MHDADSQICSPGLLGEALAALLLALAFVTFAFCL
jgi:hypothetical protein